MARRAMQSSSYVSAAAQTSLQSPSASSHGGANAAATAGAVGSPTDPLHGARHSRVDGSFPAVKVTVSARLCAPLSTCIYAGAHFAAPYVIGVPPGSALCVVIMTSLGVLIVCVLLCQFMDPGVVLPKGDENEAYPPVNGDTTAEGTRWCITCKLWRPARASHCNNCGKWPWESPGSSTREQHPWGFMPCACVCINRVCINRVCINRVCINRVCINKAT